MSEDDTERFEIPSAGGEDEDLTAELFRPAFRPPEKVNGVTYRWRELTAVQAGIVWTDLAVWVRWLVATYQLTTSVVPDCWWRHTEIVAELYALHRAELVSYVSDDPGFGPLAFHERLPHAVERLRNHTRTAGCVGLQSHKEPALRMLRLDALGFVEWQAASHQVGDDF
ncbi:hypothetical protein [Arthrobacter sp. Bz4]|uniref:hypothetical protein n=1 Tax=Arthrobacter sp. Bz4 TaxID=2171979 RepID=UPI000D51EEF9|nr:hypothetical protein [Arthrobacter sp. Bz4]PVE19298.1 hypothetical protein DDA93_03285 [Arthrobacter sp. Bz4]